MDLEQMIVYILFFVMLLCVSFITDIPWYLICIAAFIALSEFIIFLTGHIESRKDRQQNKRCKGKTDGK